MEADVVYHDRWLLVVNKPSGLASQPGRDGAPDVYSQLSAQYPYVGLHHRLDRPASGLLLLTLDRSANAAVAGSFKKHRVKREYHVVFDGAVPPGLWSRRLDGKAASTRVEVVGTGPGLTGARVSLETGRTHQIRRHGAMEGHPVLGDHRYGEAVGRRWPRLALHASRLCFEHPITQVFVELEASIPDDLADLWARLSA